MVELDAIADGKRLHELEAYPATREVFVGVCVIESLGVENGYCGRQHIIRHMVVADDEIDSFFFSVRDFVHSLDAAVEYDDQADTCFNSIVYSFVGHAVAFVIAVGDVIVQV